MRLITRSYGVPKGGNTPDEYEDAFYPSHGGQRIGGSLSVAVADGASEGMLSGQWARILVRAFCRSSGSPETLGPLLERAHVAWHGWREFYLAWRAEHRPIQWFEEPGLARGAFSTLLGLTLGEREAQRRWQALALGDSCVFQVRAGALLKPFPIEQSSDFGSRPYLIASNPAHNAALLDHVRYADQEWEPGDRFYLMTDALAQWFLARVEAGETPWEALDADALTSSAAFAAWIGALRADHALRNDDATVLAIEMG